MQVILLVGTKLQVIITKMGLRIQERGEVVKGVPVVQPGDDLFWFNRPRLILYLINFVLFQVQLTSSINIIIIILYIEKLIIYMFILIIVCLVYILIPWSCTLTNVPMWSNLLFAECLSARILCMDLGKLLRSFNFYLI